jgi:signal transduction histidine kinase
MQVSDTGCGIPLEAQAYIFDSFRQVDGTATRKQHTGSGLGLSIVKQLTALMDGQITLTSKEGQGSTFTVLLPLETN